MIYRYFIRNFNKEHNLVIKLILIYYRYLNILILISNFTIQQFSNREGLMKNANHKETSLLKIYIIRNKKINEPIVINLKLQPIAI